MRTILITGGTGFLGGKLAQYFSERGISVVSIRRPMTTRRFDNNKNNSTIKWYEFDKDSLISIFDEQIIDAVIHTATCYGRKGESASEMLKINVVLPIELMELSEIFNVRLFVNTDTTLPRNLNNYTITKKHFLNYAKGFIRTNKLQFVNVYLESLYGPGDDATKFLPELIQFFLRNQQEVKLTSGEQLRDYIYIDDVLRAYELILKKSSFFGSQYLDIDLGTGSAQSLKKVIEKTHKLCESKSKLLFGALPQRKNEMMITNPDISKMLKIGWSPEIDLELGLRKTIEFYKMNMD